MPTPILLFPGIMGSRLYFPNSGKFWDPDSGTRMLRWLPVWPFRSDEDTRVQLHAREPAGVISDNANDINEDKRYRGWSGVAWGFYSKMLNDLESAFGHLSTFAVGYDWRQDIEVLADYAYQKIDEILRVTHEPIAHIVTHSMGGLVVRAALKKHADLKDRIGHLVHVCIPAAGAVLLYRRLFTGMIPENDGGNGVGDRVFRLLLGNSRNGFQGNFSGLPGAAQLLPSPFMPKPAGGDWNDRLKDYPDLAAMYRSVLSPPGIVSTGMGLSAQVVADLRERVEDIIDFQGFMGDPATSVHPNTWSVYGNNWTTETRTLVSGNVATPVSGPRSGDGTVPTGSVESLKLSAWRTSPLTVEHGGACQDANVRGEVIRMLQSPVQPAEAVASMSVEGVTARQPPAARASARRRSQRSRKAKSAGKAAILSA